MDAVFQPLFVDPIDHASLRFDGAWTNGMWQDGWLHSENDAIWPVRAGIPDFVRRAFDGARWTYADVRGLLAGGQYRRNWEGQNGLPRDTSGFGQAVRRAAIGCEPIVDVASGPGGGAMPFIVQLNPDAHVLAVDAGTPVLYGWREYLAAERPDAKVSFAGFDFTHAPFRDDSIGIITSICGFSNIIDQSRAWREAARILKPDGEILAFEMYWDPDGRKRLADALAEPHIASDDGLTIRDRIEAAGLVIKEEFLGAGRPLRADDNELAARAAELGIEVWLRNAKYVITKT